MAEFVEVLWQMKRLCHASNCKECPIAYCTFCGIAMAGYEGSCDEFRKTHSEMESKIMQWATEHPEPVYPILMEWQKAINKECRVKPITPCQLWNCRERIGEVKCHEYTTCASCAANERIPPDVAEKLGIKPKGEDHATD